MNAAALAALVLVACNDSPPPQRAPVPTPSDSSSGFYARPAATSVDLAPATVLRCHVTARGEAIVGHPPAGATSTLARLDYDVADCTAIRGTAPTGPLALVGFTMLAPAQRADDDAPTLSFDTRRFFDGPAHTGDVLVIAGGPAPVPPMGFEGNGPELVAGTQRWPARVIALDGADRDLERALVGVVGWSAARSPQAALDAGHPLVALDALRVALAARDPEGAELVATGLLQAGSPAAVQAAARAAIDVALSIDGKRPDAERLRALRQ